LFNGFPEEWNAVFKSAHKYNVFLYIMAHYLSELLCQATHREWMWSWTQPTRICCI